MVCKKKISNDFFTLKETILKLPKNIFLSSCLQWLTPNPYANVPTSMGYHTYLPACRKEPPRTLARGQSVANSRALAASFAVKPRQGKKAMMRSNTTKDNNFSWESIVRYGTLKSKERSIIHRVLESIFSIFQNDSNTFH